LERQARWGTAKVRPTLRRGPWLLARLRVRPQRARQDEQRAWVRA
jgi:hypothetical protein